MIKNIGLSFIMSACIISCGSRSKSIENVEQCKREISYIIEELVKSTKKEVYLTEQEAAKIDVIKSKKENEELEKKLLKELGKKLEPLNNVSYDKIRTLALKWREVNDSESDIISFIISEKERISKKHDFYSNKTSSSYEDKLHDYIFGNGTGNIIYAD